MNEVGWFTRFLLLFVRKQKAIKDGFVIEYKVLFNTTYFIKMYKK